MAPRAGSAPLPPWSCTVSVGEDSQGEMHTWEGPAASCVPVRPCRVFLRSGSKTTGSEMSLRTSTSYPEKPVVQPRGFGTRWLSPLEPYPFGGPRKHSRHFQIRLRHWYRRSSSAAESSSPEAPAHPLMRRSTSGRREECQGYCWYTPFRGPSTFHWQLNWLRSARGAMVPWGFATTVILRPAVLPPEVDLACLQPGRELDRDRGISSAVTELDGNGAWPQLRDEHPQWGDDSSTNATSACLLPRHMRQRSWPSPSARQRPHPETHGWHVVWSKTQLVFIKMQRQVCQMQRRL